MYSLEELEAAFLIKGGPLTDRMPPQATSRTFSSGDAYSRRLASLFKAHNHRFERCLDSDHDYPSDSEASMAVVSAMVARHFSDSEIWQTLEGSLLFGRRVEKKGDHHARVLYEAEITKARATVQPFEQDPGDDRANRAPDSLERDRLPEIIITDRHLRDIAADAWQALLKGNDPPRFFEHAGSVSVLAQDEEGRSVIDRVEHAAFTGALDRAANWMRLKRLDLVPARPPGYVIEDMMAMDKPLPLLRGIVGTPVVGSNGSLSTEPGYQPLTRLYYAPSGIRVPPVPLQPSPEEVRHAVHLLTFEWLGEFPFLDGAAGANAVAAALTVVARELIVGPTPLFILDAPAPGTGKGLLAETIGVAVYGAPPGVMNDTRVEEEMRKRITSALRDGLPVIQIDNVGKRLASETLAAALTSTFWVDRLLGNNDIVRVPNRALWLATGNNVELSNEMARRSVWVRLDARVDRPWERSGFRHPYLGLWVRGHRQELVWALLVLIQNWLAQGRPVWTGQLLGSFESWSEVVGGTLQSAGIPGFLSNREELYRRADTETEEWRVFIQAWWDEHQSAAVKTGDVLALTQRYQLLQSLFAKARDNATERSLLTRLGTALSQRRDRRFGPFFIRMVGSDGHAKGALYRLEPAPEVTAEPSTGQGQGSAEVPQANATVSDSKAEPAEAAEPETAPVENTMLADNRERKEVYSSSAVEVPQVPHLPQADSEMASSAAEPAPVEPDTVQDEVPQVPLEGLGNEVRL
jgi:hypothetical protein